MADDPSADSPADADVREWSDETVRIQTYDPEWPRRFEQERDALERAIGDWATGGIHHVGSTAVPRLDAKPVVDILVGVHDLGSSRSSFGPLARLGYLYAPYRSDEMHWFCKPHPSRRTHHLHLVPTDSRRFRDELDFATGCEPSPRSPARTLRSSGASHSASSTIARRTRREKGEFLRSVLRRECV